MSFILKNTATAKSSIYERNRRQKFVEQINQYEKLVASSKCKQAEMLNRVKTDGDIIVFVKNIELFDCITKFKPPKDHVMYLCDQLGIAEEFFKECNFSDQDIENFNKYKKAADSSEGGIRGMPSAAVQQIQQDDFKTLAKQYFTICMEIETRMNKLQECINNLCSGDAKSLKMCDEETLYRLGYILYPDKKKTEIVPYFSFKEEKISIPYLYPSTVFGEITERGIKIEKAESKFQEYLHTLFSDLPVIINDK